MQRFLRHDSSPVLSICFSVIILSGVAFAEASAPAVIDWSKGDSQAIDQSCGDFTFAHMEEGHSYTLFVRGRDAAMCSFSSEGLTFTYPANHGTTTQGKRTLYSFVRFGSEVLVTWAPGY